MAIYYAKEIKASTVESVLSDATYPDWDTCWIQGSNEYWYRAYLQYDLSKIPHKSKITSAKLRAYQIYKSNNAENGTTNIARVTESWEEATHCWNNKAATEGRYLTEDVSPPGVGNWTDWDVTTLVQEWVDQTHPNYGLMIVNNNEGEYRRTWYICNRRHSNGLYATYLEIEYEPEEEVRITKLRMSELADQARRLGGVEGELSLAQMKEIFAGVSVSDSGSDLSMAEEVMFG